MPLLSNMGLQQDIQKMQAQMDDITKKLNQMDANLKSMKTEFGIALGKVLQNQEISKPIQDEILKFTDEWFGTEFSKYGFPE